MTTTTISPADDLYAYVKASVPGDTILLSDGAYAALSLYSNDQYPLFVKAAPGVTVAAAPGAHPVIAGLSIDGGQNLTFRGIEVRMTPTQQYGVFVGNSTLIGLDGMTVHQADGSLQGVGVFIRGSTDISVTNSELHHLGVGVSAMDSPRLSVSNSRFHDIESDGIDFAGAPGASAVGNHLTDFYPGPGTHPDGIQLWATAANPNPSGAVIKDNIIQRGAGYGTDANGVKLTGFQADGLTPASVMPPQGVFSENNRDMIITGNALLGTMFNGIGLSNATNALIQGNFVQACADMGSRIIVRGGSVNVTVTGNTVSDAIVNLHQAGDPDNINFVQGPNTTIPAAAVGDVIALTAWLAARGSTPAPAPVPPPPVPTPPAPVPPAPPPTPTPPVTPPVVVDSRDALIAKLKAALTKVIAQGTAANAKRQGPTKADMTGVIATAQAALK